MAAPAQVKTGGLVLDFNQMPFHLPLIMRMSVAPRHYDTSTDTACGRIRRRVVSWLGLILLISNMVGAVGMPVRPAEAGPAPIAQDLLGDRIVVCTAAGMVVLDRDGNPVETGQAAGHTDFCVFCLPLMHGGVDAPTAIAIIDIPAVPLAVSAVPTAAALPTPVRLAGAASPRAPPLS
jgi:hypothetical protein